MPTQTRRTLKKTLLTLIALAFLSTGVAITSTSFAEDEPSSQPTSQPKKDETKDEPTSQPTSQPKKDDKKKEPTSQPTSQP